MSFGLLKTLDILYQLVWGAPLLLLLLGSGIYLTIALRGLQFRYLPYAFKLLLFSEKANKKEAKGDISHFQSLMTALAGSIGIGNIAGIATGVMVGGLGAVFWMWIIALIGMATKYAEAFLAVKYRQKDKKGNMSGGPMYFIESGLKWKWLAFSFALFGSLAAFGGGNLIQANSVAVGVKEMLNLDPIWSGVCLALIVGLILLGGIRSIGKIASFLVPFMVLIYIVGGCVILFSFCDRIPFVLATIVKSAFTGQGALGGFVGSTMLVSMQVGICRGVMTSEAGMGTTSIASAAARTDLPGRQAMIAMTGNVLATLFLCSITGFVIGVTGVLGGVDGEGKILNGAAMTIAAFQSVIPGGKFLVGIALILFALTTLLAWAYYGEKCVEYLIGSKWARLYRFFFTLIIIPGALLELEVVWKISDIANGLMVFPNILGILALSRVIIKETDSFLKVVAKEERLEVLA